MDSPREGTTLFPESRKQIGWTLLFLLFVAATFNYPRYPTVDLDASWRMAFGYFFKHDIQFGRDVVFNYGPLGFVMAKTYSGLQFMANIVAQLALAALGAGVFLREGRRMTVLGRWAFFPALLFFGVTYEDALQMIVIAVIGFQLLRGEYGRVGTVGLTIAMAVMSIVKFTNFMLAGLVVGAVVALALWRGRRREAWLVGGAFAGGFLATWLACGQNPLNLFDYFRGSWEISSGYNDSMGITTPWPPLWKAFVVLGVLGGYLLLHLRLNPDKPRALANAVLLAGFVFVNWKHGFVRADGHMIGFFFCALLPLASYPALLDDPPRCRRLHQAVFLGTAIIALWGIESSLYHTFKSCLGIVEGKIWGNLELTFDPAFRQQMYHDKLLLARETVNLVKTRAIVGQASVDVLGFEQAAALFNDFNYRPRPVFQSYSVFTPYLSGLNARYYESAAAPEFVLLKIQAIDGRLPGMDDAEVLRLLPHRYDYVHSERGFQLWRRTTDKFDPATIAPKPLLTTDLAVGAKLPLDAYAGKQVWARIELKRSLLGRLHAFLYKPVHVQLVVKDSSGGESEYRLPLPIARTGFILNPLIDDAISYAAFSNGRPGREARSISLKIKPGDRLLFADSARVELSELKPAHSAENYFNLQNQETFHMFKSYPIQFEAHVPISEAEVDGRPVVVLHAPSEMVFNLPRDARQLNGAFGYLPGAYTKGGDTNGAEFVVNWSGGGETVELYRRFLDPVRVVADRGLQEFKVDLSKVKGGRLYLRIEPGPYGNFAWDWTAWSGIEIK